MAAAARADAAAARMEAEQARIDAMDAREAMGELAKMQLRQAMASQPAPEPVVVEPAPVEVAAVVDEPPKSVAKSVKEKKTLRERWGG
jgi:hypothetical protein